MNVTDHFSPREFDQHARHGFLAEPYPDKWVKPRLLPLCTQLEIFRAEVRARINKYAVVKINSGYRSEKYNRKIGGARRSQHVQGTAADIVVPGVPPSDVYDLFYQLHLDGLIKIGGLGYYPTFCHVDVRHIITPSWTHLARWVGARSES